MNRKITLNSHNLAWLGAYVLLAGLLVVFAAPLGGWKALEVLTPSMTPAVHAGDLVLVHRVSPASLHPGNIITYTNPNHPGQTITHRLVRVEQVSGVRNIVTKGDANQVADPPVPIGRVIGRVAVVTPGLGRVLGWVKTPLGVLLIVVIPGLLVIWHEVGNIRRTLRSPRPRPAQSRRIDGLYRPAAVLAVAGLAVAAGGFTLSQSTASLVANSFSVGATTSPTPTVSPTVTPTPTTGPTASPGPGTGCGDVSITNTGPGSVNEVHCSSVNISSSNSSNSVHVSSHSSQTTTSGSVHVNGNTSVSGGSTAGGTANHSSSDITVTIP
jgi:signal peptidase